jgi:hypothetical protein
MAKASSSRYFSAGAEICLWLLVGPIGGDGPASHAMAGIVEIGIMIVVVCLATTALIARLVYRVWPIRWLKSAWLVYLVIIICSIGSGLPNVFDVLERLGITLLAGLTISILLGVISFLRWLRNRYIPGAGKKTAEAPT